MLGYLGFAVMIAAITAVEHWYGPIGVTRLFGLFFIIFDVFFIFAAELPVHAGQHLVATLTGWKKAFAIVPVMCLGLLLIFYAAPITCMSTKYRDLCATEPVPKSSDKSEQATFAPKVQRERG